MRILMTTSTSEVTRFHNDRTDPVNVNECQSEPTTVFTYDIWQPNCISHLTIATTIQQSFKIGASSGSTTLSHQPYGG